MTISASASKSFPSELLLILSPACLFVVLLLRIVLVQFFTVSDGYGDGNDHHANNEMDNKDFAEVK